MDSSNVAAIIAAAGAIAAAAIAAWVTRKGAKESQQRTEEAQHRADQLTAAGLYTQLAADQRTDITDLRSRVTSLETTVLTLQGVIAAFRQRARLHMRWDDELVADYNNRVPGANVRPAPPLLEEDEVA